MTGTYAIRFADSTVTVSWSGVAARALVEFLYGPATPLEDVGSPSFTVKADGTDHTVSVWRGARLLYAGTCMGTAAGTLLDWTVHDLAADCHMGPLFHAAALSYQGRGVLFPASSGAGKTTLAAWLTSQGWDYLSDELGCIESHTTRLQAFQRPLYLRTPVVLAVERQLRPDTGPDRQNGICHSQRGLLVQAMHLNPHNTYQTPEIACILFPQYRPTSDASMSRLSPAQACLRLMETLVNARNLPGHGLAEVSRLARRHPAYTLTYGQLDHVSETLAAFVGTVRNEK